MKAKILLIVAAIIGSLCITFALWQQDVAMHIVAAVPLAAGSIDNRFFWWPLCTGAGLFALAFFGFLSLIFSRRKNRHK